MKKIIFIGVVLCAFILLSLPSINAVETNTIEKHEKLDKILNMNREELLSFISELKDQEASPKMFFSSLLLAYCVLSIIIAALVYYYVSGFIEPPEEEIPSISFACDFNTRTITVTQADTGVLWSDLEITGDCNTSGLSTYITAGDQITECYGQIRIVHIPSNALLASTNFN